jgi:hypothetical protein
MSVKYYKIASLPMSASVYTKGKDASVFPFDFK